MNNLKNMYTDLFNTKVNPLKKLILTDPASITLTTELYKEDLTTKQKDTFYFLAHNKSESIAYHESFTRLYSYDDSKLYGILYQSARDFPYTVYASTFFYTKNLDAEVLDEYVKFVEEHADKYIDNRFNKA